MIEYKTNKIKNVGLFGHKGCGKTTILETILEMTKTIEKRGSIDKGTTVSDFLKEELDKKVSYSTSLAAVEYKDHKINFLDTPGTSEMQNDALAALRAIELAIVVLDASKGVEVGTLRVWKTLGKMKIPRILFVNKLDKENTKLEKVLNNIKEKLGADITPFMLPIGEEEKLKGFIKSLTLDAYVYNKPFICEKIKPEASILEKAQALKSELLEKVAESSEELLDKYFSGKELTSEEIDLALRAGINKVEISPVFFGSAEKSIGIDVLLDGIIKYGKTIHESRTTFPAFSDTELTKEIAIKATDSEAFSGFCFKTLIDPFIGTINLVKIMSGSLKTGSEFVISSYGNEQRKVSNVYTMLGKKQTEIKIAHAGDIVALIKLELKTGDSLCDKNKLVYFPKVKYVLPILYLAIVPKNKQDEDKISGALKKLNLEDPSFERINNKETKQLLIGGLGMSHLKFILKRMKSMFKVDVEIEPQKIAYRETIKKKVEAHGKHKKQSGGAGQFGEVHVRFEPSKEIFEFSQEIFGGAVPKNYHPAVEKGLQEAFERGPLAGFPVIFIKSTLFDGSYHPVDSNELSFKMAAHLAFKDAVEKGAQPILLEPIMRVKVIVEDQYVGDIMGDISKRRGKLHGTEPGIFQGEQIIIAEIPESEIISYATDLKAMTQGSGTFKRKFLRYEEVPQQIAGKIIEEAKTK